jgi:pimeloyl-ACP methyl ester carboxylesterase
MPRAQHGEVELEYEVRGPADGETVLLVMGIGAQLISWNDGFCDLLVDQGYRVVRFDNRDAGLSSGTPGPPPTRRDLARLVARAPGARASVPYRLSDMAADAVAVLDAVDVPEAHVVGASMGGMIAQTVAIEHGRRVRSLTSIMSNTGSPRDGIPSAAVLRSSARTRPTRREAALAHDLARSQLISGPHFDPVAARAHVERAHDRSEHRDGVLFQMAAILASGDRTAQLRRLRVPTLVIHGRRDRLIRLRGGVATARAVPDARLVVHDEMAHDLPKPLWPSLTGAIARHAQQASTTRPRTA